ncbi:TonB-dependent receptor [Luteithermobacter gelatinilyticus]|uniref:TonB-dependent receptor n=1 Tax=Luteithermobacter gelatinilyticus TaxID=2582913 RepID=UPI0011057741|nr:TonB-dependent receptor [Luteithermobacter gelatinilyticus]
MSYHNSATRHPNRRVICNAARDVTLAATTALVVLGHGPVLAEEAAQKEAQKEARQKEGRESIFMDEIVITAQKREQSAQDVGISITAFSGSQLQALGYTNAQEVTALAAGVSTLQPNGEANYSIGIRGVANNDFTTNVESPVAIYVDEVYISQMSGAGFMLFDIDRVEVLRGPQGTLFGRNATGGLVQYVTVKPSQEFNGYGSISYGSFERIKFQGAVGMPISDKLSARVSVATHQGDGYVTNRLKPDQKLNNANEYAGRLQLLFEPSETVDFLLNARIGKQDIRTGFFENVSAAFPDGNLTPTVPITNLDNYLDNDGDVFAGDYDRTGKNDLETYGFTGTLNWDMEFATLTSITDYQSVTRDYIEDSDASPVNYFNFFLTTDAEQFSEELRLAGETETLKWVTGFYYMSLDINDSNGGITPGLFEAVFGPVDELGFNGIRNPYTTEIDTWSLFGQVEYNLTDELSLIAGFRYIDEKKSHFYRDILVQFPDTSTSGLDPNAVEIVDAVTPYEDERHDKNWSARAQINYMPNEDLLMYASWNRGVKSGGYNAPLLPTDIFVTDAFMKYEPETLDAFEVGFKWDFAEGRARLNGAAYYYDYNDYQAFSIIGLDTFTLNAQSENKGFELELQMAPADGLDLQFGIAYIDADVTEVPGISSDVETPAGTFAALRPGETVRPVQTPKWNLNGLVRYEVPLSAGSLAVQVDGQYRSEHSFGLLETEALTEDGYFVGNASVTYYGDSENWSLRVFVRNITDEEYLVQTFDLSGTVENGGLFGLVEQYYGMPRTWGANLTFNF